MDIMNNIRFLSFCKKAKFLLAEGETGQTLDEMLNNVELLGKNYEQEVIILSGEYQRWQKDFRLGLHPSGSTVNRINFALLQIIDELDTVYDLDNYDKTSKKSLYDVLYDSSQDVGTDSWTAYNSNGFPIIGPSRVLEHKTTVKIESGGEYGPEFLLVAWDNENVCLQKPVQCLKGYIELEYNAFISDIPEGGNLMIQCIPMKHTKPHQTGYIEVGSEKQADPRNPFSPFRKRFIIPREHIGDQQWHQVRIDFDFTYIPDAFYSILAPRINEGALHKGPGAMKIRKIKIYS
jgi:hypothetical protein